MDMASSTLNRVPPPMRSGTMTAPAEARCRRRSSTFPAISIPRRPLGEDLRRGPGADNLQSRVGAAPGDARPDFKDEIEDGVRVRVVVVDPEEHQGHEVGLRISRLRLEGRHVDGVGHDGRAHGRDERPRPLLVGHRREHDSVERAPVVHLLALHLGPVDRVVKAPRGAAGAAHLTLQVELDVVLVQDQRGASAPGGAWSRRYWVSASPAEMTTTSNAVFRRSRSSAS